MKLFNLKTLTLTAVAVASFYTSSAIANPTNINVGFTVANTITVTEGAAMSFGNLVVVTEAGNAAALVMQSDGTLAAASATAGASLMQNVGGTLSAGIATVTAGNGATVSITITDETVPTDGANPFGIGTYRILPPGGVDSAIANGGAAVTYTANGTAQDVAFGATLSAPLVAAGTLTDGTWAGSFEVTAAY